MNILWTGGEPAALQRLRYLLTRGGGGGLLYEAPLLGSLLEGPPAPELEVQLLGALQSEIIRVCDRIKDRTCGRAGVLPDQDRRRLRDLVLVLRLLPDARAAWEQP